MQILTAMATHSRAAAAGVLACPGVRELVVAPLLLRPWDVLADATGPGDGGAAESKGGDGGGAGGECTDAAVDVAAMSSPFAAALQLAEVLCRSHRAAAEKIVGWGVVKAAQVRARSRSNTCATKRALTRTHAHTRARRASCPSLCRRGA